MSSGAMAKICTVWEATRMGYNARRKKGDRSILVAMPTPRMMEINNPTRVSNMVVAIADPRRSRVSQPEEPVGAKVK